MSTPLERRRAKLAASPAASPSSGAAPKQTPLSRRNASNVMLTATPPANSNTLAYPAADKGRHQLYQELLQINAAGGHATIAASLQTLCEVHANDHWLHFCQAVGLAQDGRQTEAIDVYERCLAIEPNNRSARENVILSCLALSKFQDAEHHASALRQADPNNAENHYRCGVVQQKMGHSCKNVKAPKMHFRKAAECFQAALNIDPSHWAAHINLVSNLEKGFVGQQRRKQVHAAGKAAVLAGVWLSHMQRPPHFVQTLVSQPWYDPALFWFTELLEQNFDRIRDEFDSAGGVQALLGAAVGDRASHDASLVEQGTWTEGVILSCGQGQQGSTSYPVITSICKTITEAASLASCGGGETILSVLTPGTFLRPHCGPSNSRLTLHLGIEVPEGDITITCGGEQRKWEQGKCIVFDDSFEHEVLHHGPSARAVLLMNFWHPDYPVSKRVPGYMGLDASEQTRRYRIDGGNN